MRSRPTLCAFNEPSIGLAPKLVEDFFYSIGVIRDEGIAVLLIEQNVRQSLEIADRGDLLENGRITLKGSSQELIEEELIRRAYLGL